MHFTRLFFLLDDNTKLNQRFFLEQLRITLYDLRDYYFRFEKDCSLSFVNLSDVDASGSEILEHDLNLFSVSNKNKDTLFQNFSAEQISAIFSELKENKQSFQIFYLGSENPKYEFSKDLLTGTKKAPVKYHYVNIEEDKNYSDKLLEFITGKARVVSHSEPQKTVHVSAPEKEPEIKTEEKPVEKPETEAAETVQPENKKKLSKKYFIGAAAVLLILVIAILAGKIKLANTKYQKVYTGDGDRLILREMPSKNSAEYLRLNEGEVVKLIKKGEEWNQVEYHYFKGYLNNKYLIDSQNEYKITNPDSQYSYGMALIKSESKIDEGYEYLIQAASQNHLQACFALYEHYSDDSEQTYDISRAMEYLLKCYTNGSDIKNCYEGTQISEYQIAAATAEYSGNSELKTRYETKIREKENTVNKIYKDSLKEYVNYLMALEDYEIAADIYMQEVNDEKVSADSEILEKLAENITNTSSGLFLDIQKMAYKNGSRKAAFRLAEYYFNLNKWNALTYYKYCYNRYYEQQHSACAIGEIYFDYSNYSDSLTWFIRAYNNGTKNEDYYTSAYYLGQIYENGYVNGINISKAISYYKEASDTIPAAKDRYVYLRNLYYW